MRIVSTIDRPLRDEHVIGTDPPLRPELPGVWRRRINAFHGRALSDKAMSAEQEARSGIQRLRGQSVTAGVVSGLDLMIEPGARTAARAGAAVQLLPGQGLTQDGEDIVIASPRRFALGDLPVWARADHLDAIASGAPAGGDSGPDSDPSAEPVSGGALAQLFPMRPRRLGPALKTLLDAPASADLPRVAVLVAEPVTATILGRPADPCPPDPRDDPYDDLQLIDGCRLALAFWPAEMTARSGGSDYSLPPAAADRRNRFAYRVFNVERAMIPGEVHPWERLGVPLALVAFNDDWTLDFVDRAAVVRMGGRPKPRTPLTPQCGTSILWQARVAQFAEHLAELPSLTQKTLTAAFRQLPPVGFLPASVIDLARRRQSFFPAGFALSAAPMPLEQIDLVMRDSAALMPINLSVPDAIELLVPVPERVYEPGLLETAIVDPAFARAMARYVRDRSDWLIRRELVRRRRDLLVDAAIGERPSWPTADSPLDEILPYPATRGPLTVTRVRHSVAGPGTRIRRTFRTLHAGSSLKMRAKDRLAFWIRIVDAAGLTGFMVRRNNDFASGVFWGAGEELRMDEGDPEFALRRRGGLPPAGSWLRLEVPAESRWFADGSALAGRSITGIEFQHAGGTIEWGPVSRLGADGNETIWLGDDALPGTVFTGSDPGEPVAPFVPAGPDAAPVEADFGTAEADGVRMTVAITQFRGRWREPFLEPFFDMLDEDGIDGFVGKLDGLVKATNDAIDLGFVRARSDIYRVRQYMLGADAASRLVTSPALADIAVRDEGARAKSVDLSAFVKAAYQTDFRRDPDQPLETRPKIQPGSAAPSGGSRTVGGFVFSDAAVSRFAGTTPRFAEVAEARLVSRAELVQPFALSAPVSFATGTGAIGLRASELIAFQPVDRSRISALAGIEAARRFDRGITIGDVQAQLPLPGAVERTASVAERLKPSPAVEAHGYALAGKLAVRNAIARLIDRSDDSAFPHGVELGDLPAPGYRLKGGISTEGRTVNTVGDVIASPGDYDNTDELAANVARHEADYFTASVTAIDNAIALMRLVEGRIDLYNRLTADARQVREDLLVQAAAADSRLRAIGIELEEARHDVSVATALLAEERARVDALNARRAAVLDAHAKMLVFRRARRAVPIRAVATAPASAALAEPPAAACLREHDDVPEELRDFAGLFRDAPVSWFPAIAAEVVRIDRLEAARAALIGMRLRAATRADFMPLRTLEAAPRLLFAVHRSLAAQREVFDRRRIAAVGIDIGVIATAGLSGLHAAIADRASLGDLIAGEHNRPALARLAAAEIEAVGRVAGCLHASFGEAPPAVRLGWAEILSEFDRPAPLSQLAGLPGWSGLPLDLRRAQQGFVDWLFSRIDRSIGDADNAINELIRASLLLAAHSPVDRIVPARLVAPAPARTGVRLDFALDVRLARIGMIALLRSPDGPPLAQAVVEDLGDGVARARIVRTYQASATLSTAVRIDLGSARIG